jgi:hypothetical protein
LIFGDDGFVKWNFQKDPIGRLQGDQIPFGAYLFAILQAPLILNKGKMQLKSLLNGGFQELKIFPNSVDDIKDSWETQSGS